MKSGKVFFIILLLAFKTALSQSDDKLGIGIVSLSYPKKTLVFYEDTTNRKVKYSIRFSENEKGSDVLSKNKWLVSTQSLFFSSDETPLNLDLICLNGQKHWYLVKVNPGSNQSYWLHGDKDINFRKWGEYLRSKMCVRRRSLKNKVYNAATISSDSIDSRRYDCSHVMEIKGYWMKVMPLFSNNGLTNEPKDGSFGWIQWRNKNSLLIYYFDN